MNTKKSKNKNRANKAPNLNPPQKNDESNVVIDKVDDVKLEENFESAQKAEERVPEIISEVITPSVPETREKEDDSPRKPKRNKGNKKNKDKEGPEIQDEKTVDKIEDLKIENVKITEDMPTIPALPEMTASARKKKNKNKKPQEIEQKVPEKVEQETIATEEKVIMESDSKPHEENIHTRASESNLGEQETKSKKKSKKKKNRHDSEKSDKAEELCCTTAFQKLLIEDKSDTSGAATKEFQPGDVSVKTLDADKENATELCTIVEKHEITKGADPTVEQALEGSSKSKKKNKKEKRIPPPSEKDVKESEITSDRKSENPPEEKVGTIEENISKRELFKEMQMESTKKEVTTELINVENIILTEDDVKTKAKIAKPVEKKRKGKVDNQNIDPLTETGPQKSEGKASDEKFQEMNIDIAVEATEQAQEVKSVCLQETTETMEQAQISLPSEVVEEISKDAVMQTEDIKNVSRICPPDNEMGKKRKKSPKPKKNKLSEKDMELKPILVEETDATVEKESSLPVSGLLENISIEPVIKLEETLGPVTPDIEIKTDTSIESEDKMIEVKSKKKRKKSPKLPHVNKPDTKPTTKQEIEHSQVPHKNEEIIENKAIRSEEKQDILQDLLPTDIEISSIKPDESEGSTCGVTPDIIQYPRATSQDPIDDNNNTMIIQEVTIMDEIKLQIPADLLSTPTIQGSGATPQDIPEILSLTAKATEIDIVDEKPMEQEKTDIKSKMMEVNQDMEELRLSIERSLAELTAIEKGEEVGLDYVDQVLYITEDPVASEIKLSMPSEIVAKTLDEKMDVDFKSNEKTKHKHAKDIKSKSKLKEETSTHISTDTSKSDKKEPARKDVDKTVSKNASPLESLKEPSCILPIEEESVAATDIILVETSQLESIKPVAVESTKSTKDTTIETPKLTDSISSVQDKSEASTNILMVEPPKQPQIIQPASVETTSSTQFAPIEPTKQPESVPVLVDSLPSPQVESTAETSAPPICPARRDHKNKGKSKKKGKQETASSTTQSESVPVPTETKDKSKDDKKAEKSEQKYNQEKGKQQLSSTPGDIKKEQLDQESDLSQEAQEAKFEPIENFEDDLTSSADDINKTFEMIANEANRTIEGSHVNPEIKIIAPVEDTKQDKREKNTEKVNPLSQPKNLLGHTDIPVPSNRIDYKKEKNKSPNQVLAKVKIKDAVEIEGKKESKQSQTDNIKKFMKNKSIDESFSLTNENEEFIYKYSFRKVFLQSTCHVCKKELKQARVSCSYCSLVFYCSGKHKDEDWPHHQALCFAVSTIMHLKDQKHIYADAKDVTGHNYRLLRMQMIISCEKVVKRKLVPWEQEALLYPRICADVSCREWRQTKLKDCEGCGQISFCADHPDHLPRSHQRWCKSYSLYQKLVCYQQTKGRLEPRMPTKVMEDYRMPEKINEVLAAMYEEKIDMTDIQYAALTQIATAPLTAAYCLQQYRTTCILTNGAVKKTSCTVHVVGAELQFEADALNKWEVFFLHLRPDVQDLRVVLVSADLNPSNLPLDLLSKVKVCENCRLHKRHVTFSFQDKKTYQEYAASDDYISPDIVCAFNAGIKRSSLYNSRDSWPKTVTCILNQRSPFVITAHTLTDLRSSLVRVREIEQDVRVLIAPQDNTYASVRPDRNFVSDHEAPLLFSNHCYMVLCGRN